jgi:DNA-directed RNA polymerase subunit RPC12/RpoP
MGEADIGGTAYIRCERCQSWHAAGHHCGAAAGDSGAGGGAAEPRYACIECHRLVTLDDTAVHTRGGRAICLACSRRLSPSPSPSPSPSAGGRRPGTGTATGAGTPVDARPGPNLGAGTEVEAEVDR